MWSQSTKIRISWSSFIGGVLLLISSLVFSWLTFWAGFVLTAISIFYLMKLYSYEELKPKTSESKSLRTILVAYLTMGLFGKT
ncbi:MAG: hypothetical protein ACFFFH_19105 [Candidatus Thorarchaeota archaeon]